MEELRAEDSASYEVSAEYFDSFGMMPFGVDEPAPNPVVTADTNDASVRYHVSAATSNGDHVSEFTSAEIELAEARRKAEMDGSVKEGETKHFSTIDEAIDFLGFGKFQVKLILLAGLAVAADAAEMLALSVLAPAVACEWGLNSTDQAVMTMCVFAGMLVGATLWGKMSDKFGRRNCILLFTFCAAYSEIVCAISPRFAWVVVFNVLVGFSIGGTPQTGTLLSEFLPSRWRAVSLIGLQLFWAIGGCFEAVLALLVMTPLGWRGLVLLNTVPLLAFLSTSYWLPESVRYLVLTGRVAEAQITLDRVARANKKPRVELLSIDSLQSSLATSGKAARRAAPEERGRLRDLLGPSQRRLTISVWILWFLSAFAYYGIVLLTSTLFQLNNSCHGGDPGTKLSSNALPACKLDCVLLSKSDYVRIVFTTLAEFPAIVLVLFVVDKWGRRNTLAVHYAAFTVATILLNICMDRTGTTITLFAARAFVTGGHETLHVYTPESYPTSLRAFGVGSASSVGRIGAMLTPLVAQLLAGADQLSAAFALYAIAGACAAAASLLLPFETSGRKLTEHVNHVTSLDPHNFDTSTDMAAYSAESDIPGLQRRNVSAASSDSNGDAVNSVTHD